MRQGDLFAQTDLDALAHGVNVDGMMGSGIAKEFARRWPRMKQRYARLCREGHLLPGTVFPWEPGPDEDQGFLRVFNCASQDRPGRHARAEWIVSSIATALGMAAHDGIATLGVPMIGAGIGGMSPQQTITALTTAEQEHLTRIRTYGLPACELVVVSR